MRNSPFQLKSSSLFQTMEQNIAYNHHKRKLEKERKRDTSPRDAIKSLRNVNEFFKKSRKF